MNQSLPLDQTAPPKLHQKSIYAVRDARSGIVGASLLQETIIANQRMRQQHRVDEHDYFVRELPKAGMRERESAVEAIRRRVAATAVVDLEYRPLEASLLLPTSALSTSQPRLLKRNANKAAAALDDLPGSQTPLPSSAAAAAETGNTPGAQSSSDASTQGKKLVPPSPIAIIKSNNNNNNNNNTINGGTTKTIYNATQQQLDLSELQMIHRRHQQQHQAQQMILSQTASLSPLPDMAKSDDDDDDENAQGTGAGGGSKQKVMMTKKRKKEPTVRPQSCNNYSWVFHGDAARHTPFDFTSTAAVPFAPEQQALSQLLLTQCRGATTPSPNTRQLLSKQLSPLMSTTTTSTSLAATQLLLEQQQQQKKKNPNSSCSNNASATTTVSAAAVSSSQLAPVNNPSDALVRQLELLRMRAPTPTMSDDVALAFAPFSQQLQQQNKKKQHHQPQQSFLRSTDSSLFSSALLPSTATNQPSLAMTTMTTATSDGDNSNNNNSVGFSCTNYVVASSSGSTLVGSPHRSPASRGASLSLKHQQQQQQQQHQTPPPLRVGNTPLPELEQFEKTYGSGSNNNNSQFFSPTASMSQIMSSSFSMRTRATVTTTSQQAAAFAPASNTNNGRSHNCQPSELAASTIVGNANDELCEKLRLGISKNPRVVAERIRAVQQNGRGQQAMPLRLVQL